MLIKMKKKRLGLEPNDQTLTDFERERRRKAKRKVKLTEEQDTKKHDSPYKTRS